LDDQVIIDHYNNARPWYDPTEISNYEQTVRINKSGIKLYNTSLNISDRFGRDIDISNASGLMARDAQGKIIHDIPNDVILSDMVSMGHLVYKEAPDFIDSYTYNNIGVDVTDSDQSGPQNVDISAYYPGGLNNPKGVKLFITIYLFADDLKTQEATTLGCVVQYSVKYNTAPGSYNYLGRVFRYSGFADGDDREIRSLVGFQADAPIVNDKYLTWSITSTFATMVAANDDWSAQVFFYLLGFWI